MVKTSLSSEMVVDCCGLRRRPPAGKMAVARVKRFAVQNPCINSSCNERPDFLIVRKCVIASATSTQRLATVCAAAQAGCFKQIQAVPSHSSAKGRHLRLSDCTVKMLLVTAFVGLSMPTFLCKSSYNGSSELVCHHVPACCY